MLPDLKKLEAIAQDALKRLHGSGASDDLESMSQEFRVRPQDDGKGWVIDCYDRQGHWQYTYHFLSLNHVMDLREARRKTVRLRQSWQAYGRITEAARALLPLVGEVDADDNGRFTPLPHTSLSDSERQQVAPWIYKAWCNLAQAVEEVYGPQPCTESVIVDEDEAPAE